MPTIASNPENGLSIECHIETQTQYQLGKPITVKGIIRNSGASALWILRWNTFLQPHCGDCLLVTHNGSPVPYVGLRVLHGHPSAESYIRIPAGGSEERQIDLSELYGIREPGEYQVSFRLSVLGAAEETDAEPPWDPGRLKLTIIESEKVAFRIEGSGSGLPITKVEAPSPSSRTTLAGPGYPPNPRNPRFDTWATEWSDQEQKDWADAHRLAYRRTVSSIIVLENSAKDKILPLSQYRNWFENKENPGWGSRASEVLENYKKMADKMRDDDIIYRRATDAEGRVAWFEQHHSHTIFLNDFKAFDTSLLGWLDTLGGPNQHSWTRAFIAAHEMSHLAASTKDESYGWAVCGDLAANHPEIAITNAQNYALYVMLADPQILLYEPEGKVDLKHGDTIYLQANNSKYLANNYIWNYGNYIQAIKDNPDYTDCYFMVENSPYPDTFYLKRLSSRQYLRDDGCYIMLGDTSPGEGCAFKFGEFTDHKNQKCLVLKSVKTGKLLAQADNSRAYIISNQDAINQWTLFKVVKVPS